MEQKCVSGWAKECELLVSGFIFKIGPTISTSTSSSSYIFLWRFLGRVWQCITVLLEFAIRSKSCNSLSGKNLDGLPHQKRPIFYETIFRTPWKFCTRTSGLINTHLKNAIERLPYTIWSTWQVDTRDRTPIIERHRKRDCSNTKYHIQICLNAQQNV